MSIANESLKSALTALTRQNKTAGMPLMSSPTAYVVVKAGLEYIRISSLELFGVSEQLREI